MVAHEQENHQQIKHLKPAGIRSRLGMLRQKMLEQQEADQKMQAISREICLDAGRRPHNLRLLRAFRYETQKGFISTKGFPYMSESHYGNIEAERREAKLTNQEARKIESINNLPMGWLDRDNSYEMFLSHEECALVQLIRNTPKKVQVAIATLCKHIANES